MPHIRRTLLALLLLALSSFAHAQESTPRKLRVLFVGNSLTYVNDLPSTLRAIAAAQPTPVTIETQTFVAPGGSLADRWNDGKAAAALGAGHWDALVLQERGGVLARHPALAQWPCRFDVVDASGDPEAPDLRWIRAAFTA